MTRLTRALHAMEPEQRLAAGAALGLFLSMFLPWYSQTNTVVVDNAVRATQTSLSAFQAFSFVEAAVLLVSAGVLVMQFARAEGNAFHLPGGDGTIVMVAGGWTALLIFYRLLDKPGLSGTQRITATVGVQWGIFVALLLALCLVLAGRRMRARERPEPPSVRPRGRGREPEPQAAAMRPHPDPAEELTALVPRRPEREPTAPAPARPAPAPAPPAAAPAPPAAAPAPPAAAPAPPAAAPAPSAPAPGRPRPRFPPAPSEQMSFEDPPHGSD